MRFLTNYRDIWQSLKKILELITEEQDKNSKNPFNINNDSDEDDNRERRQQPSIRRRIEREN